MGRVDSCGQGIGKDGWRLRDIVQVMVVAGLAHLRRGLLHLLSSWRRRLRTGRQGLPTGWRGSLAVGLSDAEPPSLSPSPSTTGPGPGAGAGPAGRRGPLPEGRTVSEAVAAKGGEVWAPLLFLTCEAKGTDCQGRSPSRELSGLSCGNCLAGAAAGAWADRPVILKETS